MAGIPQYQIDEWFASPDRSDGQDEAQGEILNAARVLAETVNKHLPDNEEKLQVMQSIRQTVLIAEQVIRWKWRKSPISLMQ